MPVGGRTAAPLLLPLWRPLLCRCGRPLHEDVPTPIPQSSGGVLPPQMGGGCRTGTPSHEVFHGTGGGGVRPT